MFADKTSDTSSNATPAGNNWNWSNGVTEDSIKETKRELVSYWLTS